jgi:hypothetical protein
MVIEYIYKRLFTLNARQQGKLLLYHSYFPNSFIYLMHKKNGFPIFPSLDKSSFPTFKQPSSLKMSQTVLTVPTDQGTLIWAESIKFEPLKLNAHK